MELLLSYIRWRYKTSKNASNRDDYEKQETNRREALVVQIQKHCMRSLHQHNGHDNSTVT